MIGRLGSIVLETREPRALAQFYSELLGLPVTHADEDWVDIGDGQTRMSFQHAPEYQPPRWPDPTSSMQFHLDISVDDINEAERRVLELGRGGCRGVRPRKSSEGCVRPARTGSGCSSIRPGTHSACAGGNRAGAADHRRPG